MRNTRKATKPDTVRVRVPAEVKTWLARAAAKQHVDMSDIVRPLLMQAFDARHAK
jgi:antitoxin component of RelBE/YafQ-DinJ toxin-antitoxin module